LDYGRSRRMHEKSVSNKALDGGNGMARECG
jgi:hypothetical protein